MINKCLLLALFLFSSYLKSTNAQYTHADTLRGKLSSLRSCYDIHYYHLTIDVNPKRQYIAGSNEIQFRALNTFDSLQLDLFANLIIDSIVGMNNQLKYRRDGNAVFVKMHCEIGSSHTMRIYYQGKPQRAINPPWDGGFVWEKDINSKDWVGVACQGTGASCWWPCKDHQSDEPDSMRVTVSHPAGVSCVSNGQRETERVIKDKIQATWLITYPINNYNVTLNIADYVHFSDTILSGGKKLALDYYVLRYNEEKARLHFKQVPVILGCYERFFGPYPFIRDGYKLVETSYWGMEHQSCISYGNAFLQSHSTGFDYIILHETAHEWWGNQLTVTDNADMWLHEGFGTYAEVLYVECIIDAVAAGKYLKEMQWQIRNEHPVVGLYDINYDADDNDMYYKGAWILHTFRNIVQNDVLFLGWVKSLQKDFAFRDASTSAFIEYTNKYFGKDYTAFFKQYLYHAAIPVLEYRFDHQSISARWITDIKDFSMPVDFIIDNKRIRVTVGNNYSEVYHGKYVKNKVMVDNDLVLFSTIQAK
jgi:aminopeptidase N